MTASALSYEQALQHVKQRVAASRTSFHAGMALLPQLRREAMYALYAFCREVDDIADDSPTIEEAKRGLQQWRNNISQLFLGTTSDAITTALQPALKRFNLVEKDFQDIIDGMEMDAGDAIVAPDAATLDLYCDRVASAVGRASVRIFGDDSDNAMQVAHHLGRAFQLTNILRDIAEDAKRGRLYLPKELLEKHGIASRHPDEIIGNTALPAVCRDLAAQTTDHYASADAAMRLCLPSAMRPARMMRSYYGAIFDRLVMESWRDISKRVRLSKGQKLWLMFWGLVR